MISFREEDCRDTLDSAQIVIWVEPPEAPVVKILLLLVNGVQADAGVVVLLSKLSDLSQLLSEGMGLLGLKLGQGSRGG